METLLSVLRIKEASIGEDIYGGHFNGREPVDDKENKFLFDSMMRNYMMWSQQNNHVYPDYQSDLNTLWRLRCVYQPASMLGGFMFAGMVWNPNFVKRTSWYVRKFSLVGWTIIGYLFANRYIND